MSRIPFAARAIVVGVILVVLDILVANWFYDTHMSPYRPCAVQGAQYEPPYPACGLERPA